MSLIKRWWDARGWKPYDPRVDELATAAADHLLDERRSKVARSWVRLSALLEDKLRAAGVDIPGRTTPSRRIG